MQPRDLARAAARVTGIAVVAYAALRVVEFVLRDEDGRLARLLGTLVSDIIRFAIAAGFGFLAGVLVGAVTTVVTLPLIAGVLVSLVIGLALNDIDQQWGITDRLVRAIEARLDRLQSPFSTIGREIQRWERSFIDCLIRTNNPRMCGWPF